MLPLELSKTFVGIEEIPGPVHNAAILAMFRDAGHPEIKDDETAWCAAFACAMLERCGIVSPRSLLAQSFLKWGTEIPPNEAQPGDFLVFKRGTEPWQGHVTQMIQRTPTGFIGLGGNQKDRVGYGNYSAADLLGVRRAPAAGQAAGHRGGTSPAQPSTGHISANQPAGSDPVSRFLEELVRAIRNLFTRGS